MRRIEQSWSFVNPLFETEADYKNILRVIEYAGRRCYQSEPKGDPETFVKALINRKHFSVLEHCSVTVDIITNRGVTHEIVRHRIASYSQESTRYCNYANGRFGSEITIIDPVWFTGSVDVLIYPAYKRGEKRWDDLTDVERQFVTWMEAMEEAECKYLKLLNLGQTPQQAREVLPNSLKTQIIMTTNLREWLHFFDLRALGTTGKPHPQMQELALSMLKGFAEKMPIIFGQGGEDADVPK